MDAAQRRTEQCIGPHCSALQAALPSEPLFHSHCWKHIESESARDAAALFEVRCIAAPELVRVLKALPHALSALAALEHDGEAVVAAVERWMRNKRLTAWNVAMAK
jgi:hypothetical protein